MSPLTLHAHDDESVPWVSTTPGYEYKIVHADLHAGMWVIRSRFSPGFSLPTHRHTGPVHAFTVSGSWRYREYGIDYLPGTYVFEPPGSVHTLEVRPDATEPADAWFAIWGSLVNLAPDGSVVEVVDTETRLEQYLKACADAGLPEPQLLRH